MKTKETFFDTLCEKVGLPLDQEREISPHAMRTHLVAKTNKKLTFHSQFPWIGRGNVLRDNLITEEELNAEVDSILP